MAFELLICKFEVASPRKFGDTSQNVPGWPVLQFSSKHNETLLHMLHVEVHIFTVYANYVALPTKSMSKMAVRTLEREQQPAFRWKRTRQVFLKIISTQT